MNEQVDTDTKSYLEHRKSMAQVGKGAMAALAFGLASFMVMAIALVISLRVTLEAWKIAMMVLGGGSLAALVLYYALAHLRAGGEFSCRLDNERFICVSPVENCGDSFHLDLE